jgi:hypothetical protein
MGKETAIEIVKLNKELVDSTTGEKIKELYFQELIVEDYIEFKQTDFLEVKCIITLISRITGVSKETFNKMSPKDYFTCSKLIFDFLGFSQETQT